MKYQSKARNAGYDQVLWTDARHKEFIEESGTMNIMFFIDNTLITPPLSGTILDGVTRDSLLTLAKKAGIEINVRAISYKEIQTALENGKKVEAFGAGTAAVIAPIKTLAIGNREYDCYTKEDAMMYKLQKTLYELRRGISPDVYNWNYII
jgi:branched-chain amino acid aminotransferase